MEEENKLYCHWDTHDRDVLFMNEHDLDQHLYQHFVSLPELSMQNAPVQNAPVQTPEPAAPKYSQSQPVECHWDSCHETFSLDEIMEHFRENHFEESLKPHHACPVFDHDNNGPVAPQQFSPPELPYTVKHSTPPLVQPPPLDPVALPRLRTPESITMECHRCRWALNDGAICGEEFLTSPELNAHIVHCHLDNDTMRTCKWDGCSRLEAPFLQKQKLVRHLQTHVKAPESQFQARIAEKSAALKQELDPEARAFNCKYCERSFRSQKNLAVHERIHSGKKPLVCNFPGCGKRFSESSNLAKHRRTHLAPQFECQLCKRKFTRKDHLVRHQRTKNHIAGVHATQQVPPHHTIPQVPEVTAFVPPVQSAAGGSQFSYLPTYIPQKDLSG